MKEIAVLLLISAISSTIKEIHGAKLWGPGVNISYLLEKIYLKGIGERVPNLLPDLTFNDKTRQRKPGMDAAVGRRFLKEVIADQRKQIHHNTEELFDNAREDTVLAFDMDDAVLTGLKAIGNGIPRASWLTRRNRKKTDHSAKAEKLMKQQHERKMKDIKFFLDINYVSTKYIYDEVLRIKRDHVIKDPLRRMVDYLSRPGMDDLIQSVFKCFQEKRKIDGRPKDIWKNRIPNNLIINVVKDPQNDGFA